MFDVFGQSFACAVRPTVMESRAASPIVRIALEEEVNCIAVEISKRANEQRVDTIYNT